MNRLPRIVSYAGLGLGLVLLMYSCSIERDRVRDRLPDASRTRVVFLIGGCVALAVGLGILCLYDVKEFIGEQSMDLPPVADEENTTPAPDLEEAEKIRKSDPLEAIRVLREYLSQDPGNRQVMTRIAVIYEKDLRNSLAAALEYEELLKVKADQERWGWSAIHLTNLYIRLKQQDKAIALLRRIDQECGDTPAGLKARKRLAQVDG